MVAVVGIGLFMVLSAAAGALGAAAVGALVGALAVGFATLNAIGPWVLGLVGKVQLRRATTPARLLAARRLLDDPKAAWRVVGGLGLAGFVAGVLAVLPAITAVDTSQDPQGAMLMDDLVTGAMVTLGGRLPARGRVRGHRAGRRGAGPASRDRAAEPGRRARRAARRGPPARRCWCRCCSSPSARPRPALVMFFPLFGTAAVHVAAGLLLLVGFLAGGCALVFAATRDVAAAAAVGAGARRWCRAD